MRSHSTLSRLAAIGAFLILQSGASVASSMPSITCTFTEPFIGIDVFPGGVMFVTPEGNFEVESAMRVGTGEPIKITGSIVDSREFDLTVSNEPGSDGMSDMISPQSGSLVTGDAENPQQGACIVFPDGTTPRPIKDVAENDMLNVRDQPSSDGQILAKLNSRATAWAFPEDTNNGWARVAAANYPDNESGNITVLIGWVNAKFLGAPPAN
jgi:uncharacterized protein YgiM (DUF1202 family)